MPEKGELRIIYEYFLLSEANQSIQQLIQKAIEAMDGSYSPYSDFKVGAALLLENDVIIQGSNQENAAYPSGLCAERVAIFHAGANFPKQAIKALAIAARKNGQEHFSIASPCGNCRQVMLEAEIRFSQPIDYYILQAENKVLHVKGADSWLPFAFTKEQLG